MIVVTAPTGNIGRCVVQRLLDAGEKVRVIARDPTRLAPKIRDRVEVVEGSHGDAAVVDRAFAGANALFWLAPPDFARTLDEAYMKFTMPAAEAVRRHGVKRVVTITAIGRNTRWHDKAGLVSASIRMDELLMETGVAFRGLAMPSFMDNAIQQITSIKGHGVFYGPLDPDLKAPTTATRDVGEVAARMLADDTWTQQKDVAVLGPDDLSMRDLANIMSDVLGRDIRYQQIPFDSFRSQLGSHGMSESFMEGYVDMMRAKSEGMDNAANPSIVVRTPTTFRQWCKEELEPALQG